MATTTIPKSKSEEKRDALQRTNIGVSFATMKAEQISTMLGNYHGSLEKLLNSPERASRLIQVITTVIKRNPELQKCSPSSVIGGMLQAAMLNLDFNPNLGLCYLVPYGNKSGSTDAQFQLGYRGMVTLAQRSGEITDIYAKCVYLEDEFYVEYGLNRNLKHIPNFNGTQIDDNITFVYAVAKTKNGGVYFEVLSRAEVEKLRKRSPMQKYGVKGAWLTDYSEMAKAKVIKQLAKLLPMSTDYNYSVFTDGMVIKTSQTDLTKLDYQSEYDEELPPETTEEVIDNEAEPTNLNAETGVWEHEPNTNKNDNDLDDIFGGNNNDK